MTRSKVAVTLGILLALAPAALATEEAVPPADKPPAVKIEFDVKPLMLCHYYLKSYGASSAKPREGSEVDFVSEATAYSQATRLVTNAGVWRWFEGRIAATESVADLRKASAKLPAAMDSQDHRTAVSMILDAMESAYPKYMKTVYPIELNGLNRVLVSAKKRYYTVSRRISQALMDQMAFEPIARPITVFVVVRTGGVTTWGTTDDFHFTVIGSFGQSPLSLLETGFHEATHIVDALQSFRSKSILARVRADTDPGSREESEIFLHGLVAFNAGELVKRFLSGGYTHVGVLAPGIGQQFRPYLSTYEYIWTEYMDGKMTADGVSKKLVEEFEAVQALQAGQPAP